VYNIEGLHSKVWTIKKCHLMPQNGSSNILDDFLDPNFQIWTSAKMALQVDSSNFFTHKASR
jgi:hypothetical protein